MPTAKIRTNASNRCIAGERFENVESVVRIHGLDTNLRF
ncbi:hypothetical protein HCH_06090 [Hahella chejuensis KCTC 2396]|uniref:Uncharacterized protein n=1 Tax=Hahella chejuensis (strain KCTC 2396) TaxID=349521 RepID=Q2S9D6_HAHCH|nr:hypothetical protein HCH_06090 [Hahella chejuensis KCTC 2396]